MACKARGTGARRREGKDPEGEEEGQSRQNTPPTPFYSHFLSISGDSIDRIGLRNLQSQNPTNFASSFKRQVNLKSLSLTRQMLTSVSMINNKRTMFSSPHVPLRSRLDKDFHLSSIPPLVVSSHGLDLPPVSPPELSPISTLLPLSFVHAPAVPVRARRRRDRRKGLSRLCRVRLVRPRRQVRPAPRARMLEVQRDGQVRRRRVQGTSRPAEGALARI